ncbi:hypothetical protein ABBQ38_012460 [Trebouxia sp. C0009 RCD-2024]
MGCVASTPTANQGCFPKGKTSKAGSVATNGVPVTAVSKASPYDTRNLANPKDVLPFLPEACGDICQVLSPWPGCGKPANEAERLAATEKLQLIGKEPHPALQRYVDLISTCYQRQLVLLSLFDENCAQIINTSAALPFKELSRQYTPCAWALVPDAPEVLYIEDLTKDARFRDFQVVAKPPHIRSYCGTPIILANGYRVGVLCALDTQPHAMCASSTRLMVNVAGLVAREIEGLAGSDYDLPLQPKIKFRDVGLMVVDTSQHGWTVLHADCNHPGIDGRQAEGHSLWDKLKIPDVANPGALFEATLAEGLPFKVKAAVTDDSGVPEGELLELEFRPGNGAMPMKYSPLGTQVGTPAWVPDSVEEDDGMTEESGVAKHWFVHLRRIGRPSDRPHVHLDTAGTNTGISSRASSGIGANWPSGSSLVSIGQDDVVGGWDDVEVGYLLGRGSSGSVYRAKCKDQHVAVKIIAPEQDKYIKRTPDGTPMEVAITQHLDHPNIVRTLRHASFQSQNASLSVVTQGQIWSMASSDSLWGCDGEEEDTVPPLNDADSAQPPETWLMLEFCDRGSLLDAVDRGWLLDEASHFSGVLGLNRLLLTGLELAKALAYLHRLDILHGDLTGGNVMLTSAPVTKDDPRGFTVKVADFGMSRMHHDPTQTTTQGTITHMPPELVRNGLLHRSADVWAFGVLLWEMFSGQRAWAGMSYTQVMQAVGYEQRGPEWPPSAPPPLAALGNGCFELDPDKRPTFKECVEQLNAMLASVEAPSSAHRGAEGLEARKQTRPAINGADIPNVLTCSNQAPIHTEVALADAPPSTAGAA